MSNHLKIGEQGEQIACEYLQKQGYLIRARNWHCKEGEIDIIAEQAEYIVFIEVKTRQTAATDQVLMSITPRKQQRIIAAVHHYLSQHNASDNLWRVDVIGITLPRRGSPMIQHVEDAFDW